MANQPRLLGRLAVHLKMITMDELAQATRAQGRRGEHATLGDILVDMGFIDPTQLAKLLAVQKQVIAKHRAKASGAPGAAREPKPAPASRGSQHRASVGMPDAEPGPASVATPTEAPDPANVATTAAPSPDPVVTPTTASEPVDVPTPDPEPAPASAPAPTAAAPPSPVAPARPAAAPPPRTAAQPDASAHATETEGLGVASDLAPTTDADRDAFLDLLKSAVSRGASDVHLHAGAPPAARLAGVLTPLANAPLAPEAAERMVVSTLTDAQREQLAWHGELDVCHTFEGIGRFRANLFREQRGIDGVFRFISAEPPSLESLGLPTRLAKFTSYHQGMVLVTGPAGSGKSSTLAALVNLINEERREHILTIEDPIEFIHPSKRCLVNQRSIEQHTESFPRALRAALREDPDVIVIGELRDLETVSLALTAAETGHFVLATLHTDNAIRTINRLIGSFPADQQEQVRTMCSESLRAVISQRLLPRADGQGRAVAIETMVVNKAIGNLIRDNKTFQIQSILQTGASQGMGLLDQSILALVKEGAVSREEALRHCEDPKALAA